MIDKDIEIVKSIIKSEKFDLEVEEKYCIDKDTYKVKGIKNRISALENVLKELERLDKSDTSKEKFSMYYYNKYKETKSELETYKKIADFLAEEYRFVEEGWKFLSNEEVLDWVRKEVENGNNSSSSD